VGGPVVNLRELKRRKALGEAGAAALLASWQAITDARKGFEQGPEAFDAEDPVFAGSVWTAAVTLVLDDTDLGVWAREAEEEAREWVDDEEWAEQGEAEARTAISARMALTEAIRAAIAPVRELEKAEDDDWRWKVLEVLEELEPAAPRAAIAGRAAAWLAAPTAALRIRELVDEARPKDVERDDFDAEVSDLAFGSD
jgi:hypothetical protein